MKVLDIDLYDKGLDSAVQELVTIANEPASNKLISASDAHVLVMSKTQQDFKKILKSYHWNLPDGVPSVWLLRRKGAKEASRISGPDFFKAVVLATKNSDTTHYLCGGAPGVADLLKKQCESWGNKNIVGTSCPPFRELTNTDYQLIGAEIQKSDANIVWIGLGAPKQIYFAHELIKHTKVQAIVTVGAAFDFHTDRVKKAPKWMQTIGMEWLYRLIQEPKRLGKRYLKTVPLFIWFALKEVFAPKKQFE